VRNQAATVCATSIEGRVQFTSAVCTEKHTCGIFVSGKAQNNISFNSNPMGIVKVEIAQYYPIPEHTNDRYLFATALV
jgi:hypothetical protein